jgi:hypothetical protein
MHLQGMWYAPKNRFEHGRVASPIKDDRCTSLVVVELDVSNI